VAERAARIAPAWLATVVLVTLNLRPFLTAVGPLTPAIQAHTGLSLQALAWLTLLPMALMGAGTWLAPAVLHRVGARSTLTLALTLLALGCALRLVPAWLIATAALCGVGVALVQGVLPGLIKLHTPRHVAPMMGVYSAALMSGGALGAQLSPLALQWGVDWRGALALWSLPVLAALALAWRQLDRMAAPAATGTRGGATAWLLRRPRTWYLMLAFGLMNGGYASMVAWLAPHYQELGLSAARSGTLVIHGIHRKPYEGSPDEAEASEPALRGGLEALAKIITEETWGPRTPVVILTGPEAETRAFIAATPELTSLFNGKSVYADAGLPPPEVYPTALESPITARRPLAFKPRNIP